jgi:hypothetical protein
MCHRRWCSRRKAGVQMRSISPCLHGPSYLKNLPRLAHLSHHRWGGRPRVLTISQMMSSRSQDNVPKKGCSPRVS